MWATVLLCDDQGTDVAPTRIGPVLVAPARPLMLTELLETTPVDWLVVAAPRSLQEPAQLAASLAVGRFPEVAVATVLSGHAPLALMSALAQARDTTEHPGEGVTLARRMLAETWSGAWARSLGRLREPAPTLLQHARSLVPGSGFLVRQEPEPAVLRDVRPQDVPASPFERLLYVQDGAVPPALLKRMSAVPGFAGVRPVEVPGRWDSIYGRGAGQLALAPRDARQLLVTARWRCPGCRLDLAEQFCPFCRVQTTDVSAREVTTASRGIPLVTVR